MLREKLLSILDELEPIFENLLQNGLNWIAKMQNLSSNEPGQIAKMRHIKNYKNMLRENLLIVLLKLRQSHAELSSSKDSNTKIEETKNFFIVLRHNSLQEGRKKYKKISF